MRPPVHTRGSDGGRTHRHELKLALIDLNICLASRHASPWAALFGACTPLRRAFGFSLPSSGAPACLAHCSSGLVALCFPSAQPPHGLSAHSWLSAYRLPSANRCSEVESLMRHFDRNSDGVIDYVEFYNTLTRHQVAL